MPFTIKLAQRHNETCYLAAARHKFYSRLRLKCGGTRTETRFRLSAKRTSPFKSAGASVQSTTGSRVVRIGGSSAGYTMFRGNVKNTGYPLHSPVSPSLPLPCVSVYHHIYAGLYYCAIPELTMNKTRGFNATNISARHWYGSHPSNFYL